MKILLTGASGYLGKQVIKYYLSRQEEDIKGTSAQKVGDML